MKSHFGTSVRELCMRCKIKWPSNGQHNLIEWCLLGTGRINSFAIFNTILFEVIPSSFENKRILAVPTLSSILINFRLSRESATSAEGKKINEKSWMPYSNDQKTSYKKESKSETKVCTKWIDRKTIEKFIPKEIINHSRRLLLQRILHEMAVVLSCLFTHTTAMLDVFLSLCLKAVSSCFSWCTLQIAGLVLVRKAGYENGL